MAPADFPVTSGARPEVLVKCVCTAGTDCDLSWEVSWGQVQPLCGEEIRLHLEVQDTCNWLYAHNYDLFTET